jgi:hypothetical protein
VSLVTRRLRSLLIALAVLALSATAALAGRTVLSTPHHQVASQTEQGDEQAEENEAPETDEAESPDNEDADEAESPDNEDADESGAADAPTADETATTDAAGVHPDNHGKLVSEAAQGATPDGFDNHGAYVRTIAQANHGHTGAPKHTKNAH